MAARPQVEVRPGLNVWRLLRTDRDGAKAGAIPQNAAAAVRYFLGEGLSPEANQMLVPVAKNEWRFDDVRPLQVLGVSQKAGQNLPAGEVLADRMAVPGTVPSVRGKRPWWVLLQFWWRGASKRIDYPGVRAGALWHSWELNGADWVLDRAVFVAPAAVPDPGAATWTEALGNKAEAAFLKYTGDMGDLLTGLGRGLFVLVVLYGLSQLRTRR
jgi:hypothetical protein